MGYYGTERLASTTSLWTLHADAHDFGTANSDLDRLTSMVFASHFGHLSIISSWLSALFFAGARFSNYDSWVHDPASIRPTAQIVYEGSNLLSDPFNGPTTHFKGISISSGIYSAWFSAGLITTSQLLTLSLGGLSLAIVFVLAGIWHNHRVTYSGLFSNAATILKHHQAIVLGLGSISWSGHLVHASDAFEAVTNTNTLASVSSLYTLHWAQLSDVLTLSGIIDPIARSLPLSDVIHHHLAVGCILVVSSHLYRSVLPLGSSPDLLLRSHGSQFVSSWHSQLAVNLAAVGTASILAAHLIPGGHVYPYLAIDSEACLSLFTHHAWIGG